MSATPNSEPNGPTPRREAVDELDRRVEELAPLYHAAITVLGWGFRLGAGWLAIGLLVALIRQEPLRHEADPFSDVVPALLDGRARGIIDVAILWLMATPVVTVVVIGVGFSRQGDRCYAMLSFVVLAILGVSMSLSLFS